MARLLADGARAAGVELAHAPQANEVFAYLPAEKVPALQERFHFYTWDERQDAYGRLLVRWVASWDTQEDDVAALVEALDAPSA
jgi:threonine aldolase